MLSIYRSANRQADRQTYRPANRQLDRQRDGYLLEDEDVGAVIFSGVFNWKTSCTSMTCCKYSYYKHFSTLSIHRTYNYYKHDWTYILQILL